MYLGLWTNRPYRGLSRSTQRFVLVGWTVLQACHWHQGWYCWRPLEKAALNICSANQGEQSIFMWPFSSVYLWSPSFLAKRTWRKKKGAWSLPWHLLVRGNPAPVSLLSVESYKWTLIETYEVLDWTWLDFCIICCSPSIGQDPQEFRDSNSYIHTFPNSQT